MATQYTEEFKKEAVRYWQEHKDLGINACAKKLGVSKSALLSMTVLKCKKKAFKFCKFFDAS